ncbi:hypothetical protein FZC84_08940 [Rossellomorea vietnamensis]|uniref:Uncharacterized protein n=1 Tax=Rossellomorea vietnamensis TaxID=218284 RepID=A0A5D4MEK9_9BACI|nr:hypothetical protein FZC84_08940 [Rossellomorea vietnamensis]
MLIYPSPLLLRRIRAEGVRPPARLAGQVRPRLRTHWNVTPNPVAAPSPSGSNNPHRIKGKTAFFSMRNICLSGLIRALPLFIQAKPRRLNARPAESRAWSGNPYC